MSGMSTCNKCGRQYPSAPSGVIQKCQCSGGYMVPDTPEALTARNEDDSAFDVAIWLEQGRANLDKLPDGVVLPEPKDWATELWADLMEAAGGPVLAEAIRSRTHITKHDHAVIALIRERVVLKGEG